MGNNMSGPTLRGGDAGRERLSPPATDESDSYEVPRADFYASRGAQNRQRPFDFNSQAPNPWDRREPEPEPVHEEEVIEVKSFLSAIADADCSDPQVRSLS